MSNVIVYISEAACQSCRLTKKHLETRGIPYEERPINDEAIAQAAAAGVRAVTAPLVNAGQLWWDAYRPDRIDGLIA